MDWIKTNIYTTTQGIDAVTGSLLGIGGSGFEIEDATDFNNFLKDTTIHWDYVDQELMQLTSCETRVIVYLPANEQGAQMLEQIKNELARLKSLPESTTFGRLEIELDSMNELDWANNWKQYFKPFTVGDQFVIKPSWEDCSELAQGRKVLEIDPGSSFGTGQHHTTQLCIEFLEQVLQSGAQVLDMGCGSGILSIASLMLGADHVTAVDIDQNSVKIAMENAQQNGISSDKLTTYCGNVIEDCALYDTIASKQYDVIVANIVADVIIAMKDLFFKCLKDHGVLIASGIINTRSEDVKQALVAAGFQLSQIKEKQDWLAIRATK